MLSDILHETKTKKGRGGVAGGQEDGKMGDEGQDRETGRKEGATLK